MPGDDRDCVGWFRAAEIVIIGHDGEMRFRCAAEAIKLTCCYSQHRSMPNNSWSAPATARGVLTEMVRQARSEAIGW
jgi:hypothetical protein